AMLTRNEGAGVSLLDLNASAVAGQSGSPLAVDRALPQCSFFSVSGGTVGQFVSAGLVNAGAKMNLAGPNGQALDVPGPSFYSVTIARPPAVSSPDAVPNSFFTPGTWTLSGAGSNEIKPFSVQFPVSSALRIADAAGLSSIDRSRDTEIRWNAKDYSEVDVIDLSVIGTAAPGSALSCDSGLASYVLGCARTVAIISCTAPANAGVITIPAKLLQQLDANPAPASPSASLHAFVTQTPNHLTTFRLQRSSGPSIPGFFRQSSAEMFSVSLQ
ncbi:MAG: hypothetical protein M3Z32_07800, partial [Acidobacteriota bacterium]|nr:hypothetical protein [Acidobacteriota bacterium]